METGSYSIYLRSMDSGILGRLSFQAYCWWKSVREKSWELYEIHDTVLQKQI